MGDGIHFATQKRVSIRKLRKSVQQPFSLRCRFRRNRRPQHGEGVLAPPFTREPGSAHSATSYKSHSGRRSDWYFQSETPSSFLFLSVSLPPPSKMGIKKRHRFSMPMACGYRKRALILAYQRPLSLSVFDCLDFAPCLHHEKH